MVVSFGIKISKPNWRDRCWGVCLVVMVEYIEGKILKNYCPVYKLIQKYKNKLYRTFQNEYKSKIIYRK